MSHVDIWGSTFLTEETASAKALRWSMSDMFKEQKEDSGWREGRIGRVIEDELSETVWDQATQSLLGHGRDSGGHSE